MYKVYQLIYNKIQESLKSYIKGGQIEEKTSLTSIQITLTNVHIKKSALKDLMIPFVIMNTSKVRKIQISISHKPKLKLVVEGMHLVLNPSTLKYLNADYLKNLKFEKLEKWEKSQRDSMNSTGTFGKKLLDWLLPNLLTKAKVELKNFTFTYQDTENLQILGFPCLLVLKFGSIKLWRNNDENTQSKPRRENKEHESQAGNIKNEVNVSLQIQDFSIILKCDPIKYEKGTSIDNIYDEMKISERNYLFRPCTLIGNLKISSDSTANTLYSITIDVNNEIQIAINEYQQLFIEGFLNFINSSTKICRYSFLKPKNSAKSAPGDWWKFLIGALKHDSRFNISKVIQMQKIKEKYIELYKRIQTVIQAPVLLKLSPQELHELKEIEEQYLYEEIIEFRTQALEQIKKKTTQDRKAYSNKHNDENMKKYFKDYYSDMIQDVSLEYESADETSEELENNEKKAKFLINFQIKRIVFSLNLLNNPLNATFLFLDKTGCKCARCVPVAKDCESKSNRASCNKRSTFQRPEREFAFPVKKTSQFESQPPQEYSLLPIRKMKDVIIEHGDDLFNVGSICYKSRLDESYEPNILKEYTLLFIVIDNVEVNINGSKDLIKLNIQLASILSFDPLMITCTTLKDDPFKSSKNIEDLFNFKTWFSFIFMPETENKAHWSLRHFMKDQNALPEFEFWVHYKELEILNNKYQCLCGSSCRNELFFKEVLIVNEQNPLNNIHLLEAKRLENASHFGEKFVKDIAKKIENNLMKIFPYFMQVALRYFISEVFPVSNEQNPVKIMVQVAKDKAKGSLLEQYVTILEVEVNRLPVFLSTSCLSYLKLYLNPEKSAMQQKSIYKNNFIGTLEHLSKRDLLIKTLLSNSERSKRMMDNLARLKSQSIPKFTLELCIKSLELSIFTLKVRENLKNFENLFIVVQDLRVEKDVIGSFRDSDFGLASNIDHKLDTECFILLKSSVKLVTLRVITDILSIENFQIVANLNPFVHHPSLPNVLADLHIHQVRVSADKNLVILIHILKSLDLELAEIEQASFKQTIFNDIRQSETEYLIELQRAIIDYNENKIFKSRTKLDSRRKVGKEEIFRPEKRNFVDEAFKKHDVPSENCKHCVIKYLKIIFLVHISVGSIDENTPGLVVLLKEEENIFFEAIWKHLIVKVEERPLEFKLNIISSKIVGKSDTGDSLNVLPGYGKQKIQALVPVNLLEFFPLTYKFYYQQGSAMGYPFVSIKKILYQVNEGNSDNSEFKRSYTLSNKVKMPEMEVSENEIKVEVFIYSVFINVDLLGECKLITGVLTLGKWLGLGSSLTQKNDSKIFVVKNLCSSTCLKINSITVKVELGDLVSSFNASNIEISVLPIMITPPFSQILYKGKDADAVFAFQKTLKISNLMFEVENIISLHLSQIEMLTTEVRESKVKIINKIFTCFSSKLNEKLEIKVQSCKITSGTTLLIAIPGDFYQNSLNCSKGKYIELKTDKTEIFYIIIPQVGINLEVNLLKSILQNLTLLPKIDIKVKNYEDEFIINPTLLHHSKTNPRLSMLITDIYLHLYCEKYQILALKLYTISIFNNLPKEIFEFNNFNNLKEYLEDRSQLYSFKSEIVLLFKSVELLSTNLSNKKIVEFNKDYSLSVKIDTKGKKILVSGKNTVHAVIVNKVFEELILALKDLKSVKKKKSKPDTDQFTVDIFINEGDVIIPRNSKSNEFARLRCKSAQIHVYITSGMIIRPIPANEDTIVLNGKEVMVEEFYDPVEEICDFVDIKLEKVNIETFINNKKKNLGSVECINVNVCSPSLSEDLEVFSWKTDSVVSVGFRDLELKASLSYFLNLQMLFENNFDEEVTLYPKVKKVQKVNLNFNIDQSEVEIQAIEVKQKELEIEDIKLELKPFTSVELSPLRSPERGNRTKSDFAFAFERNTMG